MKQQCPMVLIYLNWLIYLGVELLLLWRGKWLEAAVWLVFLPLLVYAYLQVFTRVSRFLGYGRVDDKPAREVGPAPVKVTFYGALSCPFCPIVEERLETLRKEMGFSVEKIDVTLRPGLLAAKGIRSVPVVEVGDRRHVGHATSEQLASLIRGAPSTS